MTFLAHIQVMPTCSIMQPHCWFVRQAPHVLKEHWPRLKQGRMQRPCWQSLCLKHWSVFGEFLTVSCVPPVASAPPFSNVQVVLSMGLCCQDCNCNYYGFPSWRRASTKPHPACWRSKQWNRISGAIRKICCFILFALSHKIAQG